MWRVEALPESIRPPGTERGPRGRDWPEEQGQSGQQGTSPEWLNHWMAYTEWLLDIRLTQEQRNECQKLWIQHWAGIDQSRRELFWTSARAELQRPVITVVARRARRTAGKKQGIRT